MNMTQEILDILRSLGNTRSGRGRRRTVATIALLLEDETRLDGVIKEVYRVVADQHKCEWTAVERNIRTVSQRAWRLKREKLEKIARYELDGPPSAAEFLEIVTTHLLRQMAADGQD